MSADNTMSKGAEDPATSKGDEGCVTSKGAKILDNGGDDEGKKTGRNRIRRHQVYNTK